MRETHTEPEHAQFMIWVHEAMERSHMRLPNAAWEFPFGRKHKGERLCDVYENDPGYIKYILGWPDLQEETREIIQGYVTAHEVAIAGAQSGLDVFTLVSQLMGEVSQYGTTLQDATIASLLQDVLVMVKVKTGKLKTN